MREYPTNEDLDKIRNWTYQKDDPIELANFICEIWNTDHGTAKLTGKKIKTLELVTGDWSGNEGIIEALMESDFWTIYWRLSMRGGYYVFTHIKEAKV